MICFLSAAGMLRDEVCCGVVVAGWSEIGHPSMLTSVLAALVVACDGAMLRMVTNMETAKMG